MNQLYWRIDRTSGYMEEKDANKYLVFDSTDENNGLLKIYMVLMELETKSKK